MRRIYRILLISTIFLFSLVLGYSSSQAYPSSPIEPPLNNSMMYGWKQANSDGFGDPDQLVASLEVFNGQLYASNTNWIDDAGKVYRTSTGYEWELVEQDFDAWGVVNLEPFNDRLYAATWRKAGNSAIWSTMDGSNWTQVMTNTSELSFSTLSQFNGTLYAGTYCSETEGATIWQSTDGLIWTTLTTNGNGDPSACGVISSAAFGDDLYFGVGDWAGAQGGRIWRTGGITITEVVDDGFGDPDNHAPGGLAVFRDELYASIDHNDSYQVWRSDTGDEGSWVNALETGPGQPGGRTGLIVADDTLYLVAENDQVGLQVWRTTNGINWQQIGFNGLGDPANYYTEWEGSLAVFNHQFFIGMVNFVTGGEVWQFIEHRLALPIVQK